MDIIPASDYWWRYFIYGGLCHFLAVTPLAKTDRHAELLRFFGYAVAVIPVFLREGIIPSVLMVVALYALTLAMRYFKSTFTK